MPRQKQYQWSSTGEEQSEENYERKSRSQLKRESSALQELGSRLARVPLPELERMDLEPKLIQAFRDLPRITSNEARRRHFQYIGKLMRNVEDIDALKRLVED